TIWVLTHDAMGDGEDGPTHQPIEHLASLRAMPGLVTLRPGDANEVVEAYRYVMQLRHQPAVLALSRQPLPTLDRRVYAPAPGRRRGRPRARGCPRRNSGTDPHRFRQGGEPGRRSPRQAGRRRHPRSRRLDAVVGDLRTADAGISRQRAAARRDGAPGDRAG